MNQFRIVVLGIVLLLGVAPVCSSSQDEPWEAQWALLTHEIGEHRRAGRHDRALTITQQALELAEDRGGSDHPGVGLSLVALAVHYKSQGDFAQAEPLYSRAIPILETLFGPNDPFVAQILEQQAAIYRETDRDEGAEELEKRAAAIRSSVEASATPAATTKKYRGANGAGNQLVGTAQDQRAELFRGRGDFDRAETLYDRALSAKEDYFGPNDPKVALTLHNMAGFYWERGNDDRAEALYLRALEIRETALGLDHTDTVKTRSDLVSFFEAQGQRSKVEELKKRIMVKRYRLASLDAAFEPAPVEIAQTEEPAPTPMRDRPGSSPAPTDMDSPVGDSLRADLIGLPIKPGQLKAFEALEPDSPQMLTALDAQGSRSLMQGRYADAELFLQRALEIRERTLGPDHREVILTLDKLASVYDQQGRNEKSAPLHERVAAIRERSRPTTPVNTEMATKTDPRLPGVALREEISSRESQQATDIADALAGETPTDVSIEALDWPTLWSTFSKLRDADDYDRAVVVGNYAVGFVEETFSSEYPTLSTMLHHLAWLYKDHGEHALAEPLYRRGINIMAEFKGGDDRSVRNMRNELLEIYEAQGRPEAIVALDEHLATIIKLDWNTLSVEFEALRNAGEYDQAVTVGNKAIVVAVRDGGPDHRNVSTSLHQLAMLHYNRKQYAQAEPLFRRVLQIDEQYFGSKHGIVANALYNVAHTLNLQEKYTEAETYYKRAILVRENDVGFDDPRVGNMVNTLAIMYLRQKKYAHAEPLFKRWLRISEIELGSESPEFATSVDELASRYVIAGRPAQAEPLFQRVADIREKSLGPDAPEFATSLNNLGFVNYLQGRYVLAEPLYKRALDIQEKVHGLESPRLISTLNNLAIMYKGQKLYAQAEPHYRRIIDLQEKTLGPEHPDVARSLSELGGAYFYQDKFEEAEPIFKRALQINERIEEPNAQHLSRDLVNLGNTYFTQKRFADAEPLLLRGLKIEEKLIGPEHPDLYNSLGVLAITYSGMGRFEEAESFQLRALQIAEQNRSQSEEWASRVTASQKYLAEFRAAQEPGKTERDDEAEAYEKSAAVLR